MDILKKEVKFNRKYIIFVLMLNFLVIGFYYSYAVFVTKQLQENVAILTTVGNAIKVNSDSMNDGKISVLKGEKIDIELNLSNGTTKELYYSLLHKKVATGVMVYETNHDGSSSGKIEKDSNVHVLVTIENNTSGDIEVEFYCQASSEAIINKEMGYSFINRDRNFDHSGANQPIIDNLNAIPVYYNKVSNTDGTWKKADQTNTNSEAIWYDYDNGRWANIVLVNEEKRDYYLNSDPETVIDNSDILAYFVWIPSFRYVIINNNHPTNYERDINVILKIIMKN